MNEQSGTESPNDSDDNGLGSVHANLLRSSLSGNPDGADNTLRIKTN